MTRKQILTRKLLRLQARAKKLDEKAKVSTDEKELAEITEQRSELNEEIEETEAELKALDDDDKATAADDNTNGTDQARSQVPDNAVQRNAGIVASFSTNVQTRSSDEECVLESMEYRKAFMNYIQRSIPIPAELTAKVNEFRMKNPEYRASVAINEADTAAAVPLTIMRQIINTVRVRYGNLYNRVAKTSIPGGVEYPIGELQAEFSWINDNTVSPEKGIGELENVVFKYNVAEIRIAQTFLSSILTIDAFDNKIAEVIATAYLKAMDTAIAKGTGVGMPLGILNDPRVTGQTGHTITLSASDINDWTAWRKKFFAKLPLGYRAGEFVFTVSTVDSYIETMADNNNNPIFRQATGLEVNDGDAQNPNGRFFGRYVSLVEPNIVADFDTASSGDYIGWYWVPEEAYAINENFGFFMRRYYDERSNKWIDKALVVVDGKVLNPKCIYLLKKA